MTSKKVITWKNNKPVLEESPLQTFNESQHLIQGYTRKLKWIFPISIIELIISYYPHKYNIYGIGLNQCGEFSVSHNSTLHHFEKLSQFESICDDCNDIYYGKSKFLIKTMNNDIYSVGNNHFGACCSIFSSSKIVHLSKINKTNLPKRSFIRLISNGLTSNHTFIITSKNKIFAFGINDNGQFGNGTHSDDANATLTPLYNLNKLFSSNNKIIKICTGLNHTLFLTNSGHIWSCGKNKLGECGIERQYRTADPLKLIPILLPLKNIIDISCGLMHNLCIDKTFKLWVFGYNRFGQLGMGGNKVVSVPKINNFFTFTNICKIYCGKSHSFVIDDDGKCWIFGRNCEGQIGIGYANINCSNIKIPHLFQDEQDDELKDLIIIDGSCGYFHTILLTNTNKIYVFGNNKNHTMSQNHIQEEIVCPYLLTKKKK
eukprot:523852_1